MTCHRASTLALLVALVFVSASSLNAQQPGPPSPRLPAFNPPAQRKQQPQGPWNNDLMIRSSDDGNLFGEESVFTETGGVPSLTRLADGRIVAAFQWFPLTNEAAFDKVAVRISNAAGTSWGESIPINVNGLPAEFQRPFDPTVVALPDGKLRMYYSCGKRGMPQPTGGPPPGTATYSAISSDGVNYTFEQSARFAVEDKPVIDCAVALFRDKWHYTAPIGKPEDGAYQASSADGLSFTRLPNIPSTVGVNWTGNLLVVDDQLRFYGASHGGIWWSQLTGESQWTPPSPINIRGGDPAVVRTASGKFLMVYVSQPRRSVPNPFHKAPPQNQGVGAPSPPAAASALRR